MSSSIPEQYVFVRPNPPTLRPDEFPFYGPLEARLASPFGQGGNPGLLLWRFVAFRIASQIGH